MVSKKTVVKFDVSIAGITVAKLRVDLTINPAANSQLKQMVKARAARNV
jgi:hypothetical protein